MIRTLVFALVVGIAGLLWWKHDDAVRFATERAPALAAYLPKAQAASKTASRPPPAAVPVVVARAERRRIPVTLEAVGTVQSVASIAIKPRLDSQIVAVNVREGALVKEGDLLFKLDDRALKAQLAQAEATVQKDQAQLEQARRDFARADELLSKKIGTEVQRDTTATLVKVQQAQLAADRASRDNLATLLSYTEIRAPISGRIGSIALKIGTSVRVGSDQAIATVNQVDPIYVSFAVPQSLFGEVRNALARGKVDVTARVGEFTVPGTLTFVENTVDLATGTVLAKAEMSNKDERLWPGAFVNVQATLGIEADAIAVPSSAVQIGQNGPYVFVVNPDGRAELKLVTVSRTVAGDSVIAEGLSGGEEVVIDGQLRLVDKAAVQVQPARGRDGVATTGADPSRAAQQRRS